MNAPGSVRSGPTRAALWTLLLGSTLTVMAGAVLAPVTELLRTELGLNSAAAGLVVTAHGLSLALAGPAVGRATDRWGVRVPLAVGLLLYGVAGAAGLVVTSYPALIASRLVFGVGAAVVFTGTTLGLLDLYDGRARDRAMGWRSAAISVGGIAWPLVGGALGTISWHAPFAVYLLGIPLGIAAWWALPAGPASRPPPATSTDRPPTGRGADPTGDPERRPFGLVRTSPRLLAVYGVLVVTSVLLYGVLVFLPLRLAEVGVTDTFLVAGFAASLNIAMTASGLGYARLAARFGATRLVLVSLGLWTAGHLTLAVTDAPVAMLAGPVVFGLGMGLGIPALTVLVADLAPAGRRGQATAGMATATFAGQFVSPLLLGPVQSAASVTAVFLAASGLAGMTLLALLLGRRFRPAGTHHRSAVRQPTGRR